MRSLRFVAVTTVLLALIVAIASPAEAGWRRHHAPVGWGHERVVTHHVYYPRYRHVYHVHAYTDPYAYRYEPRGYYPYYNSGYWRPAHEVSRKRYRYALPPYYKAWGAKKRGYRHRAWHAEHHGRIRRGHW
ncbi:MAG: hypothetical protein NW217_03830 [Hyphomicrobiaceae bacterium]|nr:hypothetical protein [Hyphomicrobiaceae bacterium]